MQNVVRALLVAATLCCSRPAAGDLVVDNINLPTPVFIGLPPAHANSFTTGPTAATLDLARAFLRTVRLGGSGGTATYTARVFNDAGGAPGTEIAVSGPHAQAISAGLAILDPNATFDFPNFAVSANTTYWLSISATLSSPDVAAEWIGNTSDSETSAFGWTIGDTILRLSDSTTLSASGGFNIHTVPEPGAGLLLGLAGLAGAWTWLKRRAFWSRALSIKN